MPTSAVTQLTGLIPVTVTAGVVSKFADHHFGRNPTKVRKSKSKRRKSTGIKYKSPF